MGALFKTLTGTNMLHVPHKAEVTRSPASWAGKRA
jgi:hypothetical protein